MKFWEITGEAYDIVIAPSAEDAELLVAKYHGGRPAIHPARLMRRAELNVARPSTPLTADTWNEADRLEARTIGDYLDEMDAAEAERKRVADWEARQVPMFKERS